MSSVIAAWAKGDADDFERHVPLLWLGRRNRTLGSTNPIVVLLLEGIEKLGESYLSQLKSLGFDVIDGSASYQQYNSAFQQLDRFGDYEKKCFLRWLVIEDVFNGAPVIHYDGDIVFNELPEVIHDRLGDKTFVLHGCPAFVSISDTKWLAEYRANLMHFVADIEAYSSTAWKEREGWEISYSKKWAGCRFRTIISSDQDFISHLIHTDRLPQQLPIDVPSRADLVLFSDPLYFFGHFENMLPISYKRVDGVDYFNGVKVAFWHMQSDFVRYLRVFAGRGVLNNISRCPNHLEMKGPETYFWKIINKITFSRVDRLQIYREFFESSDFSQLFLADVFWKPMVFTSRQ
ncbi:hypothetical protein GHYDROH2_00930 [Geobacter hydrogenophilus]|uniref:Uncharacterized protein n=2 Tax=Geobacter hydrogenophilus TaxID=40983 RepID=A0A9W6FXE6_9BACT|nr:hypothetical protein [Geobacter hydrogenophilus]GLI36592.1 hypothetical protein GHYDROH2_00930 [Geobacter hydrogenophilus]